MKVTFLHIYYVFSISSSYNFGTLVWFVLQDSIEKTLPEEQVIPILCKLISSLPKPNMRTCGLLMHHLRRVRDNEPINQMSATNLGIVFGPTLLRPRYNCSLLFCKSVVVVADQFED